MWRRLKKEIRSCFFVAADHISTKNGDPLAHPTMKTIQKLFVEYDIDAVVVEGIQPWQGPELPMGLRKFANECAKKNFKGRCGESFYSLYLGLEKTKSGSPVILTSGEPKEKTIALKLEEAGFSRQDLVGFYLVRIIPQWRRRGTLRKTKIEEQIENQLEKYRKRVGLKDKFRYSDFVTWYQRYMESPKSFLDLNADDTAPHGGPDATYVNKISHQVGIVRDREIVRKNASILNKNKNVLVVFGGSHLVIQEPALIDMLGKPKYSQPFSYK